MKKNTRVPVRNFMFTNFKVLVTVLFLAGIFHYSQVASAGVAKTETNIPEADLVWAVSPPESVPSNQELLVCTTPGTPVASGTTTICSGSSTNISATSTNATAIYWYTGGCGTTQVGTSLPGANFGVSPATTTTYYARGYNSSGGCFSTSCTSITITVATRPLTPAVSPTSATICSGGSASITANSTNATNIYWYTGSCGGVLVGSCANNTVMSLTPATTTTYYARGYNSSGGCFSNSCTSITITVNTPPLTPTVSPTSATICSGGSASITANSSNATSIYWYTGSCGGVFVGSCANNTSMPFTPSSTTTYYARGYSTSGGCFSTSCASITVTVSPQPLTPVISPSSATICPGGSASITANSTNAASIYWFSVSCGGVFVGSCTNNTSMTLTPATTTTYYARGYSGSGCVSTGCGSITVTIGSVPGAVTVSGGGTFCNTATLNATGGSGGTIYWQGTSSAGTSTATPSTSQVVTTSGTYYFRASNNCGWGTEGSAAVVINLPPVQPGTITGAVDVPAGVTQTYSIAPVTGATSYTWTVPTGLGWVINSGQGTTSINVTTGSASGPVCVTAHNNCGDSPEKCLDIFCDITENIGIEKFNIYPNPSDGMFLIEMEIAKSQDITIKVFDVIGHVVYQNSIHDFSGQYSKLIDISKNAKGTYNLQITTGEGAVNRKIVIQ